MKILLTGVSGQIGAELQIQLRNLGEIIAVDRQVADLSQPDRLLERLERFQPDVIINPAAYTAVDKAESEPDLAYAVNAQSPGVLAEFAKKKGALFIHYSTDYVFDGAKHEPYLEIDQTNPINIYGRSKLAGELAVQKVGGEYLILRTAWVYSRTGHNFLNSMLRLISEREQLGIVSDQLGTPTSAKFLASRTVEIVQKAFEERAADRFESAVYHLTADGQATWYDFACAIKKQMADPTGEQALAEIKPISTEQYPTPAKRASYSVLDCRQITARYQFALPSWEDLLASYF